MCEAFNRAPLTTISERRSNMVGLRIAAVKKRRKMKLVTALCRTAVLSESSGHQRVKLNKSLNIAK